MSSEIFTENSEFSSEIICYTCFLPIVRACQPAVQHSRPTQSQGTPARSRLLSVRGYEIRLSYIRLLRDSGYSDDFGYYGIERVKLRFPELLFLQTCHKFKSYINRKIFYLSNHAFNFFERKYSVFN
jgi:hypothetical protein